MNSAVIVRNHESGLSMVDVRNLRSLDAVCSVLRWLGRSADTANLAQASCRRVSDGTYHIRASVRPTRRATH